MRYFNQFITLLALLISIQVSAQTYVSGEINSNTTWTKEASPYVIQDSLVVNAPAILTLEAGTNVLFKFHPDPAQKSYMKINGGIRSNGHFEDFVVFTSERDDSFMDLHGDGQASIPRPGDWGFIHFNNTNPREGEHGLDWTLIRYGGGRNPDTLASPDLYPMLTFRDEVHEDDNTMWVNDCQIEYSSGVGIRMGNALIKNTYINNCAHGILLTSSTCGLTNSKIENNSGYPVLFEGLKMTMDYRDSESANFFIEEFAENSFQNNGQNYFAIGGKVEVVEGDEIPGPMTFDLFWRKLSIPYLVTSPLEIHGLNLYMYRGTLIKFKYFADHIKKPYIRLDQESSMYANMVGGDAPIVFTSEFDHRYDYEPYKGNDRDPMPGDWAYLEGNNFNLQDCVFKYGGLFADPISGQALPDSSAALRIRAGVNGSTQLIGCLFNSLYRNGILVQFEPSTDHPVDISYSSFLLAKDHFGIKTFEPEGVNDWSIQAANNYWYGSLGPFHPDSNALGNGCRVDDGIHFKPFLKSSDDELELVSSVLHGMVKNLDGDPIPDALVKIIGKKDRTVFSSSDGSYYISNLYPGYGYTIQSFAARHVDTLKKNITILKDTTHQVDLFMRERIIEYLVDTITFKVNPDISEVQARGTAYRYYKIIDRITRDPVYGAEVFMEGLVDTFYTNYKGIVTIPIQWDQVGSSPQGKLFAISQVGIDALPYPDHQKMKFRVKLNPRDYTKMWGGKLWLKEGISIVELKQEVGASVGVQVEDLGFGEEPVNLILERGFKAGGGINLGASAKATLGPVEAGAEAEIGVNLNALMKDQFIFSYENSDGRIALAKFIVLAGSAFQYLDSPLHRYLGVALLDKNPHVQQASFSNSVGLNYHGYAGAEAGLGLTLKDSDGKESPIGAELKGSAEAEGNIDFLFTSYSHSDQLDFELSYGAEIGLGVSAGVGFDIAKLFGGGDEKDKNDRDKNDQNKKEDDGLKIKIPDLLSASANAGIKYGASISTTRGIPDPFTSLGFMYGYKYAAGASAFSLFGAGVGEDREYHFTFDFHDAYLKSILEEKVQLARDIATTDMSNLSLDITSLSGASIFSSPFATFAAEQTKNTFSFPPVPYHQTVTDLVDEGAFAVEISFGLGPVKAKFGAGIEYTEANDYLWRSGVFYDWGLYPLQTYDYIADNSSLQVGPILQDILYKSGTYMWQQIKDALIPPIFKKIPIWPFNRFKGEGAYMIPVGPKTRTSMLVVDTISINLEALPSIDSLFVYYWDWYGTEGISDKKSTMDPFELEVLEHVKSKAVELHKLDYGIGGFYQFEPNGTVIADSAVLTINYHDSELTVLLEDSSEYTIDENDLRMYVEDKSNNRWIYIGGEVNADSNTVTARIDSLGTFTLAPFIPDGKLELVVDPDTIRVEELNQATITSGTIYYNTGEAINNEEFTIEVSRGSITIPDENQMMEGVQVSSVDQKISFTYKSDSLSGIAYLKATSVKGGASGLARVVIHEKIKPRAPELRTAELEDYSVHLNWDPSPDRDVASYMVYYGTSSGPPYEGTASILGEHSPVKAKTDQSIRLDGLYKDSTYYFAIKAVDRAGNESEFSNELVLAADFNHQPVIYSRVFKVDPGLAAGTVIDTLWADDEDRDQQLTYYLAANNTNTAFSLDPGTGVIRVSDAAQLDYWTTGVDSFIIHVGVRDNGDRPLSDSTEIRIILNVATGLSRAPLPNELWFSVFPNPASDEIVVEIREQGKTGKKGAFEELHIQLINLQGQLVLSRYLVRDSGLLHRLNLSGIPPGIYSVVVQTEFGKGTRRVVLIK